MKKLLFICLLAVTLVSCQFEETMVINADGTGRMSLSVDLSEMMAFGGEMGQDSIFMNQDTVISFKSIIEEKKDSIAQLSQEEQERWKRMENYSIRMTTDQEEKSMRAEVFTRFKSVTEANDLMKGFQETSRLIPGSQTPSSNVDDGGGPELIGVSYTFEDGVFNRDAFVIDEERYEQQLDSMKEAEAFMSSMKYKIKYTFPKKIKSCSAEDALFSLFGRTVIIERDFLDYFKNPDSMDLTITLEE